MTETMYTPCDSMELTHGESWAAHATVERWLRTAVEQAPTESPLERADRVLEWIEAEKGLTRDDLVLLRNIAADGADAPETPDRDRNPLRSLSERIQQQLSICFA